MRTLDGHMNRLVCSDRKQCYWRQFKINTKTQKVRRWCTLIAVTASRCIYCIYPGWNAARELGAVVHDPFHPSPQCPAPFPGGNAVVEPRGTPRFRGVEVPCWGHKEWQTGRERETTQSQQIRSVPWTILNCFLEGEG